MWQHRVIRYIFAFLILSGCGQFYSDSTSNEVTSSDRFEQAVQMASASTEPAFPGALGFGKVATGGRGGRVIKVTNLSDNVNNPPQGSLRWALNQTGKRIIIFETGGIIRIDSAIVIKNGDVTIAGQTAPGDGIVIRGSRLLVHASNVIVRGMRFRAGDDDPGHLTKAGDLSTRVGDDPTIGEHPTENRDGISIGDRNTYIERVIVDHNSSQWSVDESVTAWGNLKNITISNNLIGESLDMSIHNTRFTGHSMGLLVGQKPSDKAPDWSAPRRVTAIRNVITNSKYRCPLINRASEVEVINNYCFNFFHFVETGNDSEAHIIKNFYQQGDHTRTTNGPQPVRLGGARSRYYLEGNLDAIYRTSNSQPDSRMVTSSSTLKSSKFFTGSGAPELPANQLVGALFDEVGARWPQRDAIDTRIITETRNKKSRRVDSPSQVGGYGTVRRGTAPVDSDNDGMPDWFEDEMGLNNSRNDANGDLDGDGYTNIEEYINGIITGFDFGGGGTSSSSSNSVAAGYPALGEDLYIEAEDMTLVSGFYAQELEDAAGSVILTDTDVGTAMFTFDQPDGVYSMRIRYFDENDGAASMRILVNGEEVDGWDWNQDLGRSIAVLQARKTWDSAGILLRQGDVITLEGTPSGGEPVRTDYVRMFYVGEAPIDIDQKIGKDLHIEAEEMDLVSGFTARELADAAGSVIQTESTGTARFLFDQPSGYYNIRLRYFDENDGVANMRVLVNDSEVLGWDWNKELGTNIAILAARTTITSDQVYVENGSVITLVATANGGEPARTDYLKMFYVGDQPTDSAGGSDSGSDGNTKAESETPAIVEDSVGTDYHIEAEDMELVSGFTVNELADASGSVIQTASTGTARFVFNHPSGYYNIRLRYFDENDGVANMRVLVNGSEALAWDWNKELGTNIAILAARTTITSDQVYVKKGSVITLVATANGSEPARTDYLKMIYVGDQPTDSAGGSDSGSGANTQTESAASTLVKDPAGADHYIEAETMDLVGDYVVIDNSSSSGNKMIEASQSGTAKYVFNGVRGYYMIRVAYYDENDGQANMTIKLNEGGLHSWTWDQDRGSHLANSQTRTTETISNVLLSPGDVIGLKGVTNGAELVRIDYMRLFYQGSSQ